MDEDGELDATVNVKLNYDSAVNREGWRPQGSRWYPRQVKSDPGVDMKKRVDMASDPRTVSMPGVQEERQANKKEQENTNVDQEW